MNMLLFEHNWLTIFLGVAWVMILCLMLKSEKWWQRQAESYRSVYEKTPIMLSAWDRDGNVVMVSDYWLQKLQRSKSETIGRNFREILTVKSAEYFQETVFPQLLERGCCQNIPVQVIKKNHEILDLLMSATCCSEMGTTSQYLVVFEEITSCHQEQTALQQSETKFQKLASNLPGIIFQALQAPDGSISFPYINSSCGDFCELDPEELKRDASLFQQLLHPDDKQSYDDSITISAKTLEPWKWEGRFITPSGNLKWFQGASRPEVQGNGDILSDGLLMDITERKLSEEALRKSEQKLALHFQKTPLAVIEWSVNFEVTEWNPSAEKIFGYSRSEAIGNHAIGLIVPLSAKARIDEIWNNLLSQRDGTHSTTENITKSGQKIICDWYNTPLVDESDHLIGVASLVQDVTESKRSEAALRESEERFRAIAQATPVPIMISRYSDGVMLYANPAIAVMIGLTTDKIVGRKINDFYDDYGESAKVLALLKQEGFVSDYEMRIKQIDGAPFWVIVSLRYLIFNGEQAILTSFFDITERKQAEAIMLERSRLSTLGAEVGVALGQRGNLEIILEICTQALVKHLDAAFVGIWTFNHQNNFLELCSYSGEQPQEAEFGDRIPLGISIIGTVAKNRQSYVTVKTQDGENQKTGQVVAFAGYPLVVEERLVGTIAIMSRVPYTEDACAMLGWVANAIAVAIDRFWAREALLSRREALLFELASQIRNSLELNDILETAVQEIKSLLQIDSCHFLWCLPPQLPPTIAVSHEAHHPNLPSLLGDYTSEQVIFLIEKVRNLETVKINNVATTLKLDESQKELLINNGINSVLLLPLHTQLGQMGAVVCSHCYQPREWSISEVELLQAVVSQLAIAINQADLYAQMRITALQAQAQAKQLEGALNGLRNTQAQLIQSEKMSSLGQMVAGIAHEINNPVNFITGNITHATNYLQDLLGLINLYQKHYPEPVSEVQEETDLIELEFLAEDLPRVLESMKIGAERISQIVLSLRNFSRLDESFVKEVDIHEGIDNTLLILQHRLTIFEGKAKIKIHKEYGQLPKVQCYAGQLNQVFMNILSNAIDAFEMMEPNQENISPDGQPDFQPQIRICTEVLENKRVVIRLIDNGPGMTNAVKKQLFDPFFTTKPVGKGTGLGLAICYEIVVQKHKGVLKCLSEPGSGAEFWIEIPI